VQHLVLHFALTYSVPVLEPFVSTLHLPPSEPQQKYLHTKKKKKVKEQGTATNS